MIQTAATSCSTTRLAVQTTVATRTESTCPADEAAADRRAVTDTPSSSLAVTMSRARVSWGEISGPAQPEGSETAMHMISTAITSTSPPLPRHPAANNTTGLQRTPSPLWPPRLSRENSTWTAFVLSRSSMQRHQHSTHRQSRSVARRTAHRTAVAAT